MWEKTQRQLISIHTLTLRVTEESCRRGCGYEISIHTLTLRVTTALTGPHLIRENFNPHPHTEGDKTAQAWRERIQDFNPHPHTEGDRSSWQPNACYLAFQSTPSHWGWLGLRTYLRLAFQISIHTLTLRVTLCEAYLHKLYGISIHTLTLRVTKRLPGHKITFEISIHTLTLRVTVCRYSSGYYTSISIHTLTLRVTPTTTTQNSNRCYFNPHPHTEGDLYRR